MTSINLWVDFYQPIAQAILVLLLNMPYLAADIDIVVKARNSKPERSWNEVTSRPNKVRRDRNPSLSRSSSSQNNERYVTQKHPVGHLNVQPALLGPSA
jgi:hypothetical protein